MNMGYLSIAQTADKWTYPEDEFRFDVVREEFWMRQKTDYIV